MISVSHSYSIQTSTQGYSHSMQVSMETSEYHRPGTGEVMDHRRAAHSVGDMHKAQQAVESQLKNSMKINMAPAELESAPEPAVVAPDPSAWPDQLSPENVSSRVVGFIESRLEAEKEDGATDEILHTMFDQAEKGLEEGLREAKEHITLMDMFSGEVKDTFYKTITLIDEGMNALESAFFGEPEEAIPVSSVPEVDVQVEALEPKVDAKVQALEPEVTTRVEASEPETTLDLDKLQSSQLRGNERYFDGPGTLFYSQENQFDMEVITQDGDVITIQVGGGGEGGIQTGQFGMMNSFDSQQSFYQNISFVVDGDLDEGELAALNDLFSQVNDIADYFYSGDVGKAFEEALAIGYDAEELADFTINMTQTEVVVVTNAYQEVADALPSNAESSSNRLQEVMDTLSDFVARLRDSYESLDRSDRLVNVGALFADLLGELVPEDEVIDEAVSDGSEGILNDVASSERPVREAFRQFIDRLLT